MVGRTHRQVAPKRTQQRLPKLAQIPAVAIRYDPLGHAMPRHHGGNEQLCEFLHRNRTLTRHKIHVFRHTIHKRCNSITAPFGDRQVSNDVHCTFLEHILRWRQWLQQPQRLLRGHFCSLANTAPSNMCTAIVMHTFPVIPLTQHPRHAIQPQVACQRAVMMQRKQGSM